MLAARRPIMLVSHENGEVTFMARSKDKTAGNPSRPFKLSGIEFTRRWALHILPTGFTKVRRYGGYSGRLCRDYLDRCRESLGISGQASPDATCDEAVPAPSSLTPTCPHCETPLERIIFLRRPSWKDLFNDHSTCPTWHGYSQRASDRSFHRPREPDG